MLDSSCLKQLHLPSGKDCPGYLTAAWQHSHTTESPWKVVYMLSIKTTLVICLCLVSILSANPLYRTKDVDSVPAKDIQLLHGSESKIASNTNGKLCSSSDILCKLHRRIQDFYIWKARPLELILPLHHSAPVFREFYNAILTQVNEQWSLQTPLPSFWIKQRNLELLFKPVGGPIPWSVVARFAYNLLCAI